MSKEYHPEIDDTPMSSEEYSARYRYIIGCCTCINILVKFDIMSKGYHSEIDDTPMKI
jgi:hypothetical protein